MPPSKITPETKIQIRELYRNGVKSWEIQRKFSVSKWLVEYYTDDLPRQRRNLTTEEKQEIRELFRKGWKILDIANKFNVCYQTIRAHCKGIERISPINGLTGYFGIRGKTLEILQKLVKEGYYVYDGTYWTNLKTLKLYFPIKKVDSMGRVIYFLEGKEQTAFKVFIGLLRKKRMEYQDLGMLRKLFGIK